jgi:uncharacterized protein
MPAPSSPLGFGLGLRAPHYDMALTDGHAVDWFEIISENYLCAHAGYTDYLTAVRTTHPLVMHGVSLSIGSTDALDRDYLDHLRALADRLEVAWVSDHLCYTGINGYNTHDLLPIPYTEEALAHLIPRIHAVQERIGRPMVFENASSYLQFAGATLTEPEFLTELCQRTGCGILLDLNNIHVSCRNHGWDSAAYLAAIPAHPIVQYHLAGHTDKGSHLVDTHNAPVADPVWQLYADAVRSKGFRSTLVEWDADIPLFAVLVAELDKARAVVASVAAAAKTAPLLHLPPQENVA